MELSISHWGNSLGLRIPKTIAKMMGIERDAKVMAEFKQGKLIISPTLPKGSLKALTAGVNLKTLVAKVRPKNMHRVEELYDAPVGKEIW